MSDATTTAPPSGRIVSLDQFRGYTVAGMFVVNFLGSFEACPRILRHTNDYCSYADTIMPQFLFAVGFAFRLTFERRVQREGAAAAYARVIRRLLGLAALALMVYVLVPMALSWPRVLEKPGTEVLASVLKRDWFQTLLQIAVTSLWILPVIRTPAAARIAFAAASVALHVALSAWFNFEWVNTPPNGIDGGPLGFLTWTIPAIVGSLACDMVAAGANASPVQTMLATGLALMLTGWVMSCGTRLYDVGSLDRQTEHRPDSKLSAWPVVPPREAWAGRAWTTMLAEPPFVPPPPSNARRWNYWMMSQRGGTLSYLTLAAGFSMAVFALFYVTCDRWGWRSGVLQTFGVNALAGYVLHDPIGRMVSSFVPRDSQAWWMWVACGVYLAICWLSLRVMEKGGIFMRL